MSFSLANFRRQVFSLAIALLAACGSDSSGTSSLPPVQPSPLLPFTPGSTTGTIQNGIVRFNQFVSLPLAAQLRLDIATNSPPALLQLQGIPLVPLAITAQPGFVSYVTPLNRAFQALQPFTQLNLPLPDGTPVQIVELTPVDASPIGSANLREAVSLVYQENPGLITRNDVALSLAFWQLSPNGRLPNPLADQANRILSLDPATPSAIRAESLDPIPSVYQLDFVIPEGRFDLRDIAALQAASDLNPLNASTLAQAINQLLPRSNLSESDVFRLPTQALLTPSQTGITIINPSPSSSGNESVETADISDVSYGGSGCPAGSAGVSISPDNQELTLLFDRFSALATNPAENSKSCNLSISIKVPQGIQVSIYDVDYRGFIASKTTGILRAEYFFAGNRGSIFARTIIGETTYNFRDSLATLADVWSTCGDSVNLRVNASMTANGSGMATVDSFDLAQRGLVYHLKSRNCQ